MDKHYSHNKASKPTAGQARCGTTRCYLDTPLACLCYKKKSSNKIFSKSVQSLLNKKIVFLNLL